MRNELKNWFGDLYDRLDIAATYNLVVNASELVRQGAGAAVCFRLGIAFEDLCFVPLAPGVENRIGAGLEKEPDGHSGGVPVPSIRETGRDPSAGGMGSGTGRNNAEDPENQEEVQNGKNL